MGSAATSQFRTLGGLIGIAITTTLSTPYLRSHLLGVVTPEVAATLLQRTDSISALAPEQMNAVRTIFGEGYNLQIKLVLQRLNCQ